MIQKVQKDMLVCIVTKEIATKDPGMKALLLAMAAANPDELDDVH